MTFYHRLPLAAISTAISYHRCFFFFSLYLSSLFSSFFLLPIPFLSSSLSSQFFFLPILFRIPTLPLSITSISDAIKAVHVDRNQIVLDKSASIKSGNTDLSQAKECVRCRDSIERKHKDRKRRRKTLVTKAAGGRCSGR